MNRKDSRDDGAEDASSATILFPSEIVLRCEEELRDDKVSTSVNLHLQVLDAFLVGGGVGVLVGISRDRHTKPISKFLPDELHQVTRIVELGLLLGLVLGWITSQRQNVANTRLLAFVQDFDDLRSRTRIADQVKIRIDTADVLSSGSNLEGDVVGSRAVSAGSPCHVDEKLWISSCDGSASR